ncbi:hypothetical protein KQX54_007559, partial [Cotesia glomerata]
MKMNDSRKSSMHSWFGDDAEKCQNARTYQHSAGARTIIELVTTHTNGTRNGLAPGCQLISTVNNRSIASLDELDLVASHNSLSAQQHASFSPYTYHLPLTVYI